MTWETAMRRAARKASRERRRWRVYGQRGTAGWYYAAMPADEYQMMTADLP